MCPKTGSLDWLVDGDVGVNAVSAVSLSQWTNAVACAAVSRLWCRGRSVEITHKDVIPVRFHYAWPHRDKCAVPFGRGETTGCWWWCCWMGCRRWGLGTIVFGRCSQRVTLFTIVNTKNGFYNILPVVLHVPGVEQGYWNDFTEWWLLTRNGFLYEIEVWSKYIALVMAVSDDFSEVGLKQCWARAIDFLEIIL